jgi:hypothetical protein
MSTDDDCVFSGGAGVQTIRCEVGALPLAPGEYLLNVATAQLGGRLSWDVLNMLPGFRVGGEDSAAWLRWPQRPGSTWLRNARWSEPVEPGSLSVDRASKVS